MDFNLQNRYSRLIILWLFIAAALWLLLYLLLTIMGLSLPVWMQTVVAALGSGYLVSRFLARRVG